MVVKVMDYKEVREARDEYNRKLTQLRKEILEDLELEKGVQINCVGDIVIRRSEKLPDWKLNKLESRKLILYTVCRNHMEFYYSYIFKEKKEVES